MTAPLSPKNFTLTESINVEEEQIHRIVYSLAWSIRPSCELLGKRINTCAELIQRKCIANGWKVLKLDVKADYISLTLVVFPKYSAEEIVRLMQKHLRSEIYPKEKRVSPWEPGYLAIAIQPEEETTDAVQSFVERQRERRKR